MREILDDFFAQYFFRFGFYARHKMWRSNFLFFTLLPQHLILRKDNIFLILDLFLHIFIQFNLYLYGSTNTRVYTVSSVEFKNMKNGNRQIVFYFIFKNVP